MGPSDSENVAHPGSAPALLFLPHNARLCPLCARSRGRGAESLTSPGPGPSSEPQKEKTRGYTESPPPSTRSPRCWRVGAAVSPWPREVTLVRAQRRQWRAGLGWTLGGPSPLEPRSVWDGDTTGTRGQNRVGSQSHHGLCASGRGRCQQVRSQSNSARWSPWRALLEAHSLTLATGCPLPTRGSLSMSVPCP